MKAQQNSKDMKTVVETYVIEETQELIYDDEQLAKWNALVEELNLQGQTAIVKPTKSPVPFLHMPPRIYNTFNTLCPVHVPIEKYSVSPIPVEILSLAALASREGYFERIEIWYDDKAVDPACIGIKYSSYYSRNQRGSLEKIFTTKAEAQAAMDEAGITEQKPYGTNERYYLLGRWGDVKRSFEELVQRARQRYVTLNSAKYKKEIKEAERHLADVELDADEKFMENNATGDFPF